MLVGSSNKRIQKIEADIQLLMEDRKIHQQQIDNLIRLFDEYKQELDRRRMLFKALVRKTGMGLSFLAGISLPLYI